MTTTANTPGRPATRISLPADDVIQITRGFAAPRDLVFDAWTKPDLVQRWWGPPGWTVPQCEIDLKPGGAWRYVMRNQKGKEMVLGGIYREIVRPERLVYTQTIAGCEGQGDSEALVTATFASTGNTTLFTEIARYPSKAVRDTVLAHGTTEEGMDQVFHRLAELLESLHSRDASTGGQQ